jgi:FecR protein
MPIKGCGNSTSEALHFLLIQLRLALTFYRGLCLPEVTMVFRKSMFLVGALLVGLTVSSLAYAAKQIGEVVAVIGQPQAKGETGSRNLSKGDDVFENDRILVSTGNAQILLRDGTRLVVGPGSNLLLDAFVLRSGNQAQTVSIKALRGTFRFITGKSKKSAYKISTSSATIGIRGTGFDFWVKKKTGAVVLNGAVVLKGLNGGSVDVKSGCQMGEATTSSARAVVGLEKNQVIKENLPFLLDQSSLTRRFRLDVTTCRLRGIEREGGNTPDQPQNNQRNRN